MSITKKVMLLLYRTVYGMSSQWKDIGGRDVNEKKNVAVHRLLHDDDAWLSQFTGSSNKQKTTSSTSV